jgi:hypothetical protein
MATRLTETRSNSLFTNLTFLKPSFQWKTRFLGLFFLEQIDLAKAKVSLHERKNQKAQFRPKTEKQAHLSPFAWPIRAEAWASPKPYRNTCENLHAKPKALLFEKHSSFFGHLLTEAAIEKEQWSIFR